MANGQHVLLVDGILETEQVLRAILEPRGLQVRRIGSRQLAATAEPEPALMVVDEAAVSQLPKPAAPRVIIGSAELPDAEHSDGTYLQKPFHYSELIRAIESLLPAQSPAAAESA